MDMATIDTTKSRFSCDRSCNKCCSTSPANLSHDENSLSLRMIETIHYDNTPFPSSIATTSTIEHSSISHQPLLSSTLKNVQWLKRRSRYSKLFQQFQMMNRRYMLTLSKILSQMRKELFKLKRRTHRVEKFVVQQNQTSHPIIRIPRLTLDNLSTICLNDTTKDDEPVVESSIEKQTVPSLDQPKYALRHLQIAKKRGRPPLWINNRQKPFDPSKYCSVCRHSFTNKSNYLSHMKRFHPEKSIINTDNQPDLSEHEKDPSNVVTADQSESETFELTNSRTTTKRSINSVRSRTLCDICQKSYRTAYIQLKSTSRTNHPKPTRQRETSDRKEKRRPPVQSNSNNISDSSTEMSINKRKKHKLKAHGSQERVPPATEIDSISNKPSEAESTRSTDPTIIQNVNTPLHVTVVDMDTSDEPIRFAVDTQTNVVLAVTCLEPYQLELVEKFLKRFPSNACQTATIDSRTTHLITNDEKEQLRSPLSMKLIEAIAHHCYCVSYRWLIDCLQSDRIVDEFPYEIESDNTEVEPHFGPQRSRLSPNRHALFRNTCFMIKCMENADMRIINERLEDLITTCGGQIITCVTQRLLDQCKIVILCDKMYVSERSHNYEQCRALGIHFLSSDWVLESILEYRLKPFALFEEVPL